VRLMNACAEVFEEHGGHHFSGGFSVHEDHIFSFGERLNDALRELGESAAINEDILIDEVLSLNDVTHALVKDLSLLAPYGTGNRKPLFAFVDVTPRRVEQFGKSQEHLKMIFETSGGQLEAIAFFAKAEDFQKNPESHSTFTLIGHVEQSYFMGRQQIRLRIVDII
jgi:single-stranded-DNA-specific exonuclease